MEDVMTYANKASRHLAAVGMLGIGGYEHDFGLSGRVLAVSERAARKVLIAEGLDATAPLVSRRALSANDIEAAVEADVPGAVGE